MSTPIRVVLVFIVFFATYVLGWILSLFLPLGGMSWIGNILALVAAIWVARAVWLRADDAPGSVLVWTGYGAATVGAIGFAAGFFGPLIFAPEANQGPLLGIFITGPAGAVIGAIGGLFYGLSRKRREDP